uniref:Uncharacterized protein n=1 Tax=Anopheles melas TaxID=34690 RepID=A0A182UIU4_9DIPT
MRSSDTAPVVVEYLGKSSCRCRLRLFELGRQLKQLSLTSAARYVPWAVTSTHAFRAFQGTQLLQPRQHRSSESLFAHVPFITGNGKGCQNPSAPRVSAKTTSDLIILIIVIIGA